MLKLYNTLSRKKEIFKPLRGKKVGFYSCGPTVYNYAHIGNLRTFVFNDLVKRSLSFLGYDVNHVMNITDVDDKTIKGSQEESLSLKDFTRKYEKIFFEDLALLNVIRPNHVLHATESINDMVKLIKALMKKGYAYKTSDGIYFSIEKSKNYGKLAQLGKIKKTKQRIRSDDYEKDKPQDFALWKFYTKEEGKVFWNTEIGKGRPGWHIECSAMSMKRLGPSFDIHTGAVDLVFPHHTNEIAQSEGATGKKFVKYWLHSGFLTMKEGKMAKSVGNVVNLKGLVEKGFTPLDYRYMTLTKHYREQLLFSLENLQSAKNSYERIKRICAEMKDDGKKNEKYLKEFTKALEDDLEIPKALVALWKMVRDPKAKGKYRTVKEMDKVFGLDLLKKEKLSVPKEIMQIVKDREAARKGKNWVKSDQLRDKLNKQGWGVDDTLEGPKIRKL